MRVYIIISYTEYLDTKQWKCPIMMSGQLLPPQTPSHLYYEEFYKTRTHRPRPLRWETSRWHHNGPMSWKNGNLLDWNATCSDTYAPSHLAQSTMAAGAVASQAEDRKKAKYSYLEGHPGICFTPIAYETSGVVGPLSLIFLKEL